MAFRKFLAKEKGALVHVVFFKEKKIIPACMVATLILACSVFGLTILAILFLPHIKIKGFQLDTYWMPALLGAIILLATSLAPIQEVWAELTSDAAINPLKILVLFFSMTMISVLLDELGLFRYLASLASKHAQGNQFVLFLALYGLTSVLTVFTSNDVVILTLTPFICFFARRSKINPIPYLVAEFMAANTWSLMFLIGNPTNIYLATSSHISFADYFKVMAVPTLVAGIVELGLLLLLFRKSLKQPLQSNDLVYPLEERLPVIVGVSILGICLVFFVLSSYLPMEMWLIALISAASLLAFMVVYSLTNKKEWSHVQFTLKRLPYPLIPFFLSMFVLVVALNVQGISARFASFLGNNDVVWVYGCSSFLASNLINNIPMSILFTNLTSNLTGSTYYQGVYASIIGSNIGAFLTPIGALAGILFSGLVNDNNVRFTFIDFIKYGVLVSIPVLSVFLALVPLFL